ncbi:3-dehydroquinate synthase [Staphylococcus ratti]|uniref:3-dehydroquinate synthase n=1 Tax=Staphylococcus ratti TaxID=2892440 RepID=A0ABY3PA16_9STAP|nr:3-dehydroquinate synthase [Staphylococcus ratti]UEX89150.1 3-dehydroquinate synthase [Staphylococcus ratti]
MLLNTRYDQNNYPIIVEKGAIEQLEKALSHYQHVFILIDQHVAQQWPFLKNKWNHAVLIEIPAGEQVKHLNYYETFMNQILEYHPTRNTCLVAIGGGATGDFVGFMAATLLRGVDFIQVPTTLLAHDSSVGGKVGINAPKGKNLIGAFHRPKTVLYDLDFLQTLPKTEILSGYAEVYKHALLTNHKAVTQLETQYPTAEHLYTLQNIEVFIVSGIETKLNIVLADEKEHGQRKFLNLGHTFGHAIESQHQLAHGHAVMIGILFQYIVANLVLNARFQPHTFYQYLKDLQYPLTVIEAFDFDQLYTRMLSDKKNDATGIQMVLLQQIGQPKVMHVSQYILKEAFQQLLQLHNEVK